MRESATRSRSLRASRPALLYLFTLGTPASAAAVPGRSGASPADVGELAATLGRPGRAAAGGSGEVAGAAHATGADTEACRRPGTAAGPAAEPRAQPGRRSHRRVVQRVDVPADVGRANPFTLPSPGTAAT